MELNNLLHHRIGGIKSSIHLEQLEDKIAKLVRRNEPLNRQTPRSYTPQQNLCAKILSVRFVLATPNPMSIALWKLDASWIYSKETYKAGVSYVFSISGT